MEDDDFTTPYIIDTITKSLSGQQLETQANKNLWVIDTNK